MSDFLQLILTLDMTIRLATALLIACLAGLYSERAGIFDIGLEGKMLVSAFVSAAAAYETGSAWLGLILAASRVDGLRADPRAGLDHLPRQSADLGGGDQLPRLGPDGGDRATLVYAKGGQTPTLPARPGSTRSPCRSPTRCARCRSWADLSRGDLGP